MTTAKIPLEGLVLSVEPSDPAECFDFTLADYVGSEALVFDEDGVYFPLHMCGDTNTGYNWNGCHHGVAFASTGTGGDCTYVKTGETAFAQACVLPCSWVIDTINEPLVLVAEIENEQTGEKQWYIVNIIDGSELQPPSRPSCDEGLCCNVGRRDLQVVLGGCSPFAGETMRLLARLGSGLSWDGTLEVGGQTLSIDVACNDLSGSWTMNAACEGGSGTLAYDIQCGTTGSGSYTGSGTAGDNVDGTFTLSGITGCGGCTEITGVISTLESSAVEDCKAMTRTGEFAIAEACGLSFLEVGDSVVVAYVPKSGDPENTGTGTGACEPSEEERSKAQWQIVTACTARDCEPCPPPPPPEESECCALAPEEIPTTLVGTLRIFSNVDSCNCTADITVSFTLVPGSVPARWTADASPSCDALPGSGSDEAAVISDLTGLIVSCGSGTGSGSATTSGSGSGGPLFYLTRPGCDPNNAEGSTADEGTGTCDPMTMQFAGTITDCCGPLSGVTYYVNYELELIGV